MNGGWDVGPPIPEAGISRIGRTGKIFEWIGLGSQGFDESALKCEARYG
ncbi:MAG: hypothetical protein OXB94_01540 [Nitrospira sp.]|nr:hypothetical protein [Nitrospira sp.]